MSGKIGPVCVARSVVTSSDDDGKELTSGINSWISYAFDIAHHLGPISLVSVQLIDTGYKRREYMVIIQHFEHKPIDPTDPNS